MRKLYSVTFSSTFHTFNATDDKNYLPKYSEYRKQHVNNNNNNNTFLGGGLVGLWFQVQSCLFEFGPLTGLDRQ